MKGRKRVWVAAAIVAIVGSLAFLARPEDELGGIMRFHPVIERALAYDPPGTSTYTFSVSIDTVVNTLHGRIDAVPSPGLQPDLTVTLPSGRHLLAYSWDGVTNKNSCILMVPPEGRVWYLKAWESIKTHLGL